MKTTPCPLVDLMLELADDRRKKPGPPKSGKRKPKHAKARKSAKVGSRGAKKARDADPPEAFLT